MSSFNPIDDCETCAGKGFCHGKICDVCEGSGEAVYDAHGEMTTDEPTDQLEHSKDTE